MPTTWREFITYFDTTATSPTMELSSEFLSRSSLLSGDVTGTKRVRVLTNWVLSICALRLPNNIRRQYPNLPTLRRHHAAAAITVRLAGKIWPRLPAALQQSPRLACARQRVGRPTPRGRVADWIQATLPPPYGLSYRQAGISLHGNTINARSHLSATVSRPS